MSEEDLIRHLDEGSDRPDSRRSYENPQYQTRTAISDGEFGRSWPVHPVLIIDRTAAKTPVAEHFYATAFKGSGLDDWVLRSQLLVPTTMSPASASLTEILDGGGIELAAANVRYDYATTPGTVPRARVRVRGVDTWIVASTEDASFTGKFVYFDVGDADHPWQVTVTVGVDAYTDEELVRIADGLATM